MKQSHFGITDRYKDVLDKCKRVDEDDCFLNLSVVDPTTYLQKLEVLTNFLN